MCLCRFNQSWPGVPDRCLGAHLLEEDCGVEGLGENVKRVTFFGGDGEKLCGVVVAGNEQNAAIREHLTDGNRSVDSVHSIHHHICDEVVKGALLRKLKAAFPAVYGCRLEAADVEHHCECVRNDVIVINDENFGPDGFHELTWGGKNASSSADDPNMLFATHSVGYRTEERN